MKIEPPLELRRRRPNFLARFFSYIGFLMVSAALGFGLLMLVPVSQPVFKLTQAEGVEIYQRTEKTWREATKGEEVKTGTRLRTYNVGWADLVTEGVDLKLIGGSEIEISRLYIWDRRPQLHLLRGFFYARTQDPGLALAMGQIAPAVFKSPFFSALSLFTIKGKIAGGFDPSLGHARVYAVENPVQLHAWFPWKEEILQEKQSAEIFTHPYSLQMTPLSESEIERLEDGIKKIAPVSKAPATAPSSTPAVVPVQSPASSSAAATVSSPSSPNAWDLNSFSLYKTKSSAAEWHQNEFRYDVPSPESVAGITFNHAEVDASKYKILKMKIEPIENTTLPEILRIEIKSGERVLRVLTSKLKPAGGELQFPLRLAPTPPLSGLTLVVTHAKAGAAKRGGFRLSELSFS
jgi:hypothetical protein